MESINTSFAAIPYISKKKEVSKNKIGKCYTCKPRGTLKDHIISQTEHFTFNHDLFRRPMVIITSKLHYHTIYEIPDYVKLQLFEDIRVFVDFWNLNQKYQLVINNGEAQTHHHFHIKMIIETETANRMRRDHFTRINLEKSYLEKSYLEKTT
jgi:hypothetical protein